MTKTIVLFTKDLSEVDRLSDKTDLSKQRIILNLLNDRQQEFVKQYTWRTEFNWFTGETELSIRKKQFSTREWTQILFLFPHAQARKGPLR